MQPLPSWVVKSPPSKKRSAFRTRTSTKRSGTESHWRAQGDTGTSSMPALITDAQLEALLRGAEGSRVEFKTTAQRDDVKKTVVAFANSIREPDCGVVLIGVKDDA